MFKMVQCNLMHFMTSSFGGLFLKSTLFNFFFIVRIVLISALLYYAITTEKVLYWFLLVLLIFFAILDVKKHKKEKTIKEI